MDQSGKHDLLSGVSNFWRILMDDQSLWKLMREFWIKIEASFDPAIKAVVKKSELNIREWMLLIAALTFEPEDTTPSHLIVRGPYTSSDQFLTRLEHSSEKGYLVNVSNGSFRLSAEGKDAVLEFIKVAREAMAAVDLLSPSDAQTLAELLERLVKNCINTPPPPNTWSIALSYKLMPAIEPAIPFIEQALSCLSAYRDDAHLASWRSSGLSAIALECITLVWRGQVSTFDEITKKLSFRGHPDKVYVDALTELRARSYLSGFRNVLRLTEEGKLFRDGVEAVTDQYFFAPWTCLTEDEKVHLAQILSPV
jgi:hypothetical protein